MKKVISIMMLAGIFAACSSPKYTYHFDHYDYNSGKKATANVSPAVTSADELSPLIVSQEAVVASNEKPLPASTTITAEQKRTLTQKIASMSSEERRELKQNLKTEIRKITKAKKNLEGQTLKEKKVWDNDLKYAAIFGAIGIVLLAIGGDVLIVLGAIAMIVGLVFLIMWLSRQ
jgi:hypothetical protein